MDSLENELSRESKETQNTNTSHRYSNTEIVNNTGVQLCFFSTLVVLFTLDISAAIKLRRKNLFDTFALMYFTNLCY
jgi:hypothetical protein